MSSSSDHGPPQTPFWRSRAALIALGFLAAGAVLLLSEHRAHALGWLPFLLLLACPLMHVFMHGGHGGHGGDRNGDRKSKSSGGTGHGHH